MYRSLSAATVPAASRGPAISAEGGYLCECGRDFDTEHGLKVHRSRFCKLRPPGERKADVMEVEDDDEYEDDEEVYESDGGEWRPRKQHHAVTAKQGKEVTVTRVGIGLSSPPPPSSRSDASSRPEWRRSGRDEAQGRGGHARTGNRVAASGGRWRFEEARAVNSAPRLVGARSDGNFPCDLCGKVLNGQGPLTMHRRYCKGPAADAKGFRPNLHKPVPAPSIDWLVSTLPTQAQPTPPNVGVPQQGQSSNSAPQQAVAAVAPRKG